ncbi:helix-turn-helix domain-containing protein [Corallococcus terminator]
MGERIRELGKAGGLTQEQAADFAKLSAKHWQDLEGGRSNPTLSSLVAVVRALSRFVCTSEREQPDARCRWVSASNLRQQHTEISRDFTSRLPAKSE